MKTNRVLFICTGNSCRSQMAEGWVNHLFPGRVEAYSAGTCPHGVNEEAIETMQRLGVDISSQRSESVENYRQDQFNLIVTVCDSARECCPVFSGSCRTLHHSFEDPSKLEANDSVRRKTFDRVCREIRDFCKQIPDLCGPRN
jgi:arsenate reductase (thioredoxin)